VAAVSGPECTRREGHIARNALALVFQRRRCLCLSLPPSYCSLLNLGRSERNTNARGTFVLIYNFCIFRANTSDRFDFRVRRIWQNLTMGDGAWLSSATTTSTRVRHETCIVSQPTLSNGRRRDTIDCSWLQHAHYPLCDLSASCQKWSCLGILPLPPLLVVGRVIMVSSSCHSMWAHVPVCIALSAIRLLFLLVMYHARARTDGAEQVHSPFRRLFDMLLCDLYACLISLAGLWHETGARKCGACRVPGHRVTHCPLNVEGNVRCGCIDPSCGPCSASCAVCKVVAHQPDNVEALIVGRAGPRWS